MLQSNPPLMPVVARNVDLSTTRKSQSLCADLDSKNGPDGSADTAQKEAIETGPNFEKRQNT